MNLFVNRLRCFGRPNRLAGIIGWGRKPTADCARRYADRHDLPYIALEDGFLRSFGLGVDGASTHSLIIDHTGIYYDATRPSDLENRILESPPDAQITHRAAECMALIRQYRLSKYNHAPEKHFSSGSPKVLVVDQTVGDASVQYGLGSQEIFMQMLEAAIAENPQAEVWVKTHPDVVSGKKQGYLLQAARQGHCHLITDDCNPWSLFDVADKVYTVTSLLGFEALIAGCRVTCFGMPFYAGWGLTDDRQPCSRRGVERSLEQVFTAAYLVYCRYINPYTGGRCELEDTIQLIAEQKRQHERLTGQWLVCGFSLWRKSFVRSFFGAGASIRFTRLNQGVIQRRRTDERLAVWSSRLTDQFARACKTERVALWRMEDGFIRSVGLGADLVRPLSLVMDSRGIYYDATAPSDLEYLLNCTEFDTALLQRARQVRESLVSARLTKYNLGGAGSFQFPRHRRIILVPGQVETDASIKKGCAQVKTNHDLITLVRKENPDAYIAYKPHPDVLSGGRKGQLAEAIDYLVDIELHDVAMPDLLDQVDEVHTLTSLTGFEALLRGISVTTYGLPFYAGWGLTQDRQVCERRQRRLTLDELVAGALILYPIYVDPETGDFIHIETAMSLLSRMRHGYRRNFMGRIYNRLRQTV